MARRARARRGAPSRVRIARRGRAGSRSRTSPATATPSASQPPAGVPDGVPRPGRRGARGAARPVGADPRPVPDAGARAAAGACRSASSTTRSSGCSRPASLLRGEFRPGGAEREWCDPDVLRQLRRRSLARLRREVEPVDPAALGAVPARLAGRRRRRRGTTPPLRGSAALERLAEVVDQLAGRADPGVGPRARRPAGPRPRLPAPAARRARRDGRGRLGGPGQPRPRRRPDRRSFRPGREVLAPGRPARGRRRAARRARATRRSASTSRGAAPPSTASSSPRPGGGSGPRGARRALGPRLGRRGHERHVRPAARAALEAAGGRDAAAPPARAG